MTVTAKYCSDDIEVHFSAQTERCDYGVPGSPVWDEVDPDTVTIDSVEILGVEVALSDLPLTLRNALYQLYYEVDFE